MYSFEYIFKKKGKIMSLKQKFINKLQDIVDNYNLKQLKTKFKFYGCLCYGATPCDTNDINIGLLNCYETFDRCFRKVYGRFFHNTDLIVALSFEFLPKENKLMVSLTTMYPGYIMGNHGEPLQKLTDMISNVCGVTAQINLNETNNYFNELN